MCVCVCVYSGLMRKCYMIKRSKSNTGLKPLRIFTYMLAKSRIC